MAHFVTAAFQWNLVWWYLYSWFSLLLTLCEYVSGAIYIYTKVWPYRTSNWKRNKVLLLLTLIIDTSSEDTWHHTMVSDLTFFSRSQTSKFKMSPLVAIHLNHIISNEMLEYYSMAHRRLLARLFQWNLALGFLWAIRPELFWFSQFDLFCGLQAAILKIRLLPFKSQRL
jgi:hypothetical protein